MSELNAGVLGDFIESARSGVGELVSAFHRTFDIEVSISVGDGGVYNIEAFSSKLSGRGLGLLFTFGGRGVVVLIPVSSGLVPGWCDNPDATGKSKLSTFAQEWGMNLLPEAFFPDESKAAMINDMNRAVVAGGIDLSASFLDLNLVKPDGETVQAYVIWPLDSPADFIKQEAKAGENDSILGPPMFDSHSSPPLLGAGVPNFDSFGNTSFEGVSDKRRALDDLPGYSRSLLKVNVPVAAVLATARKPIKSILELGVGSVIQFDKSCEELLEVEVGQMVVIGSAEAVKVGDKFGFRIHSMSLPEERFRKVEIRREGEYRVKNDSPQIIGKSPIKSFND
ncbi:MAG: FliM/FliN family flagellar motor C-terminal domain-containing protein [Planctomycetaceae bacterium]|jgi:flagellar motor switch/type III secretory pathway protein FliN|nr:FliM/FliN family flagellar motor C-terminal domain-containing protein [Planctomycetaceae bacterium]